MEEVSGIIEEVSGIIEEEIEEEGINVTGVVVREGLEEEIIAEDIVEEIEKLLNIEIGGIIKSRV
jgi:hypothetical protein